jgi:hypothetical protein
MDTVLTVRHVECVVVYHLNGSTDMVVFTPFFRRNYLTFLLGITCRMTSGRCDGMHSGVSVHWLFLTCNTFLYTHTRPH